MKTGSMADKIYKYIERYWIEKGNKNGNNRVEQMEALNVLVDLMNVW